MSPPLKRSKKLLKVVGVLLGRSEKIPLGVRAKGEGGGLFGGLPVTEQDGVEVSPCRAGQLSI
eukprot:7398106-Pyramimonas_sp.AAC.1